MVSLVFAARARAIQQEYRQPYILKREERAPVQEAAENEARTVI